MPVTTRYRVIIERDESNAWIARIPSVPGCHTYGRSIVQALRRVREALALWVDDVDSAELEADVRLQPGLCRALRVAREARARAETERERARDATRAAVDALITAGDLGVRDIAYLLGISHQRVQQVADARRSMGVAH